MSDELQKKRLVKNEVLIRNQNMARKKDIKRYTHDDKSVRQTPVEFICECSNLDCDKTVKMSIEKYEKLHTRKDRFVIYPGHEKKAIESTVAEKPGFDLVEKFALSP